MSRINLLRDSIAADLVSLFPTPRVECVLYPDFKRAEIEAETSIITVRSLGREINIEQGPDRSFASIEIGVLGVLSPLDTEATTNELGVVSELRAQRLQQQDALDDQLESIVALFSPGGVWSRGGWADFAVHSLSTPALMDVQELYKKDTYLSLINVQFRDVIDE